MPFGVVGGVGRGMSVLDGAGYHRREGAVLWLNLRRPIVTNAWGLCDAALPRLLWAVLARYLMVKVAVKTVPSPKVWERN